MKLIIDIPRKDLNLLKHYFKANRDCLSFIEAYVLEIIINDALPLKSHSLYRQVKRSIRKISRRICHHKGT